MGNELTENPSGLKFTEAISSFDCVAINGHEEIVFGGYHSSGSKTGERKEVELPATCNGYKIVSKRFGGRPVAEGGAWGSSAPPAGNKIEIVPHQTKILLLPILIIFYRSYK